MNTCNVKISGLILFLIVSFTLHAQQDKLNRYLSKKMERAGLVGLQAAYLSAGDSIWQGNYGLKEWNTTDSVNAETLFMIASCSKPVTALGILKLADQGLLSLDDPVNDHLPFAVENPHSAGIPITIRMLLTHVSSLKDNWPVMTPLYTVENGGGDSPLPLQEFLENYLVPGGRYYDQQENFQAVAPATNFRYCNIGYALAGLIIETVSGQSFPAFMRNEIFQPLGMLESYWMLADIPYENIARPHDIPNGQNDLDQIKILPHYGYPDYPDGQIRTTTADYAKFLRMIVNKGKVGQHQFISPEFIEEFTTIQYPEVARYQAIAWNYNEFDNFIYYLLMPRLPSHTGADPGVATVVSFNPETGHAGIIFTNSPPQKFMETKVFYQEIMKRLLKEAKKAAHR